MKGIKAEHCSRKDSRVYFETSNYNIKTCPLEEWNLVVSENSEHFMGTKDAVESVLSKATKEGKMKNNRRIPLLNELKNLDVVKQSGLRDEEILAVVLYTGPMVKMSSDSNLASALTKTLLRDSSRYTTRSCAEMSMTTRSMKG